MAHDALVDVSLATLLSTANRVCYYVLCLQSSRTHDDPCATLARWMTALATSVRAGFGAFKGFDISEGSVLGCRYQAAIVEVYAGRLIRESQADEVHWGTAPAPVFHSYAAHARLAEKIGGRLRTLHARRVDPDCSVMGMLKGDDPVIAMCAAQAGLVDIDALEVTLALVAAELEPARALPVAD